MAATFSRKIFFLFTPLGSFFIKADTFALFELVAATVVDNEDAFLSTDEICVFELFCALDDDGDELDTLRGDDENEPLISFSFDVVSCCALEFDEVILVCRFLVILAYCEGGFELREGKAFSNMM